MIDVVVRWLPELESAVHAAGLPWAVAHICDTQQGYALEWWRGKRGLYVRFEAGEVEAIRVWGVNINTEMASRRVQSPTDLLEEWRWLQGESA